MLDKARVLHADVKYLCPFRFFSSFLSLSNVFYLVVTLPRSTTKPLLSPLYKLTFNSLHIQPPILPLSIVSSLFISTDFSTLPPPHLSHSQ